MSTLDSVLERVHTYTAFADHQRYLLTSADLEEVVEISVRELESAATTVVVVFQDATGQRTEIEPEATAALVRSRLEPASLVDKEERTGPGRPKLGVVSREVSLLPRHWDWLAQQRGGASAALRRLIDEARRHHRAREALRLAFDAAAKVMTILGGNLPEYEEAVRALYACNFERATELVGCWPKDIRAHVRRLLGTAAELSELARQEAEVAGAFAGKP